MFNYRQLAETYGADTRNRIRQHERLVQKLGRFSTHFHFNLQCKRTDVTPNHVRIRGRWESDEEKRLIKRTEKALLNIKIGQIVKKKKFLKSELDRLEEGLKRDLPEDQFETIVKVNNEGKKIAQEKSRATQRDKYYRLKYGEKYDDYHYSNENRTTKRSR